MSIKSVKFQLDKETFTAGEPVIGHLLIEATGEIALPGLELTFEGISQTKFTNLVEKPDVKCIHKDSADNASESDSSSTASEQMETASKKRKTVSQKVESKIQIAAQKSFFPLQDGVLRIGLNAVRFQFRTETSFPSSFKTPLGKIQYKIHFKKPVTGVLSMMQNMFTKSSISVKIQMVSFIDCTNFIDARQQRVSRPQKFGAFGSKQGEAAMDVRLERGAFCPGEMLPITAMFSNPKYPKNKPVVKLNQKITYWAEDGVSKIVEKSWTLVQHGGQPPKFDSKTAMTQWEGVGYDIPKDTPASLKTCNVEISYRLCISMALSSKSDFLSIELPIVIGTIPFSGVRPVQHLVVFNQPYLR